MDSTLFKIHFILTIFSGLYFTARSDEADVQKLVQLRKSLLKDYEKQVRPVVMNTNSTVVNLIIYPVYIQEVDEDKQIFVMDVWLNLEWDDKRFHWDEKIYGDISIDFEEQEIWKPDIKVISSSPVSNVDPYGNVLINVQKDGKVRWNPPATIRSRCSIDYSDYPKDYQTCTVNMSSWTSLGEEIDLYMLLESADTSYLDNDNPNWKLTNSKCQRIVLKDDCCPEFFVMISCNFVLSRKAAYGSDVEWAFSSVVVLLTLTMFWMPPEKGKKLLLGCTSLLILFGELLFFTLSSPSRGIAIYTAYLIEQSIFAVLAAIVMEVVVLNLSRLTVFEPPDALMDVFSRSVKKIFCLCPPDENKTSIHKDWYTLALFLDRIFFLLFSIVFVSIRKWV
ncbi:neuronal acetylcholine receptor subunit alpha-6-like [Centruroides sculpturatus]|uniref:neuronal acetylcholine receptor subunit alpha-6-like n=1 Tax=Centruroides sculpturatus TaxID=218467 RepID=UPI000C6DCEF2|nr:neuronal acetylcholine receptor subunit alpha-6-like [Centruroides sculpturatus]